MDRSWWYLGQSLPFLRQSRKGSSVELVTYSLVSVNEKKLSASKFLAHFSLAKEARAS